MKIINLMKRHFKIYLNNPMNILISMLSIVVILSLYFLFIRDFTIKAIIDYGFNSKYNELFVDQLMIFGLLIVISTTSILPICNIFIQDRAKGIIKDFFIAPISKLSVIYSYIFISSIISIFLTLITYFIVECYLVYQYSITISLINILYSLFTISISTFIAANLIFLISFFIKSTLSFSNFGNLLGVTIGFFTGVYIPIGYYPEVIRNIFFYFPLCQTTNLLRQINTNNTLNNILEIYQDSNHYIIKETFGLILTVNGKSLSMNNQIIFLLLFLSILIFLIILILKSK